jgi:O-antigen/teichoic acid export membrane protein
MSKLINNTSTLLSFDLISKLLGFLIIPLYSVLITPFDFGVISILQLIFICITMMLSVSVAGFSKFYFDHRDICVKKLTSNVIIVQIVTVVFLLILISIFWNIVNNYFSFTKDFYLLIVVISSIMSLFITLYNSYLLCIQNAKKLGLIIMSISLVRNTGLFIFISIMEDKILAFLLGVLLEQLIGFFIAIRFFISNFSFSKIDTKFISEFIRYGLIFLPTSISDFIVKMSDRIMIEYSLGFQQLGIYSLANSLANIPGQAISSANKNYIPVIYKSTKDKDDISYMQSVKFFLLFQFLVVFGVLTFLPELFMFIGDKYTDAYTIFIVLIFFVYLNGYKLMIQPLLTYYTRFVKYKSLIWTLTAIVNIGLNLYLIPIYGIMGAAIATVCSYIFTLPFNYYFSQKAKKVNYYPLWFFVSIVILVIVGIFVKYFDEFSLIIFVLKSFIFVIILLFMANKIINIKTVLIKIIKKYHGKISFIK